MTAEAKKTPNDMPKNLGADSRPVVYSSFDDRLSRKLPPGYTESLMAIDDVNHSWVLNCRRLARFCKLEADEKYEQVASSLRTLLI